MSFFKMRREQWAPHAYQQKAVKWLLDRKEALLLMEPGLGKTSIAASALSILRRKGKAGSVLIVAPRRVCHEVWTQKYGGELGKWAQFKDLSVTLLHGTKKEERLKETSDIYVINYEGLKWLVAKNRIQKLTASGVDTIIFDEVSKMKASNTARFKALRPHLKLFNRRWGLTGSPVSNHLADLFGEVYVIDQGKALGKYITHFRRKYFVPGGFKGYVWSATATTERELYKDIGHMALSMRAEDHLDMPTLVERDIWVDLPPPARKKYSQLEHDFFFKLDSGEVSAANAAVAAGKCRQLAGGAVYIDELNPDLARRVEELHTEKLDALGDLVSELQGAPILIGFEFHHELARLKAKFGKKLPVIAGGTGDNETSKLVTAWNEGELPILCAHPASMSHGLNLQSSGSHIAWLTLPWSYEYYDQFIRRIWRQGQQARRVVVHRILARDTIDIAVSGSLKVKNRTQNNLMNALKEYKAGVES